jgi:hypothetical protein
MNLPEYHKITSKKISLENKLTPMNFSNQSKQKFYSAFQPASAWIMIALFVLLSGLLAVAGPSKILNLLFPIGSIAVGLILFFQAPLLYLGFTWWIWFLAPLVRRLADYRSSFTEPSPILLAPFLVTLITLITVFEAIPKAKYQGSWPFILALIGILYGYLIGSVQASPVSASLKVIEWLSPVTFGLHLFVNWRDYPHYRRTTQRIFFWGVLITGAYGIFQFMVAPEWEKFWLINLADRSVTFGLPQPFAMRVWSTMHGPLVFADVMMAGLLLLANNTNPLGIFAILVGYLSFLLSIVRTAWLGWIIGMLNLVIFLKPKFQIRLILFILITSLSIIPLATIEPFSSVINTRIQSFSELSNDQSALDRQNSYGALLGKALTNVLGDGIGGKNASFLFDSAILESFFTLGWIGGVFYFSGMVLLLSRLLGTFNKSSDMFAHAASAITLGMVTQVPLGAVVRGLPGLILWGFLGIGLAAQKYHSYQALQSIDPPLLNHRS